VQTRTFGALALLLPLLAALACTTGEDGTTSGTPARAPTRETAATTSPTPPSTPAAVTGGLTPATVVRVIDGDTIEVEIAGQKQAVRYIGIDTPETVDPRRPVECLGREASERNRELVLGKTVGLEKDVSETDAFGRLLRYVWTGDEMVNATLVREGYAQASTHPPDVKYASLFLSLQREAVEAGRGLWGPACEATPVPAAGPAAPGTCEYSRTQERAIKGNISVNTGEKIYHVPGGEFYEQTVIDESKGERWFCTEAEAVEAGWRRSKR
jgi:micrococcal nuclease